MEKQMWEESERRRAEERRSEKRKNEKKEDAGARKGRESRNTAFFQWFVAPLSRKVGSLKRRVRSHVVRWEMESCMPLWREARFQGKMYTKHTTFGPLLEVEMSRKCTPLWREAHFEVNMYKTHQLRTTFGSWDVAKVHAVVARSTFRSEHVQNTPASDHFWKLRCRKSARRCGAKHIRITFGRSDVVSRGRRKGLCTLSKVSKKTWGFRRSFNYNHHYTTLH